MAVSENGNGPDSMGKTTEPDLSGVKTKRTGPVRWTIGVVVRLCIWYALLTPFFRCPSKLSDLDESSPRVCKPYLVVRSHVEPHLLPYYNIYAASYVDSARPYVSVLNEHVYSPAAKWTKQGYDKYGAPAWDQAQAYGQTHWEAQVAPHLKNAQEKIGGVYNSEVDPHVQRAVQVVSPYYEKASTAVTSTYGDYVIPFYRQSVPFIGKTYTSGQEILTTTAVHGQEILTATVIPHAQNSWSSVVYFANSSLWPKITGLYSENVEPQLIKIGQRLASYRDGKRLRESVEDVDRQVPAREKEDNRLADIWLISTSEEALQSAGFESTEASQVSSAAPTTASTTEASAQPTLSPAEQAEQAREKIKSDLESWQKKFSVAAERGAKDLEERVEDIVASYIASGAKSHGESLAIALDTIVADELSTIKSRVNNLAESLPYEDAPEEEAKAQDELLKDIKRAAITIRERAQAIREWHRSFDEELLSRVSAAINSTLDILDSVRDLGLQEIGMRWAWMDDVTYKDWAKYHSLKAQFDDWRSDVSQVGMKHGKFEEAQNTASELLGRGMEVAESAAKDLAQLKDVGKWKISAREANEDFNPRPEPPPTLPKPTQESDADVSHTESASSEPPSEPEELDNATESAPATETPGTEDSDKEIGADDQILGTDQDPTHQVDEPAGQQSGTDVAQDPVQTELSGSAKASPILGAAAAEVAPEQPPMQNDDSREGTGDKKGDKHAEVTSAPLAENPLDYISSLASSKLAEQLSAASAQLAQVRATVPPAATPGQNPIILDAQRRYYEAIGLAHDHYAAFISTASGAVYGSPTPAPSPATFEELIEDARSGYSQASSMVSASLDAVVSSASSVVSPTDPAQAQEIFDDASSRYSAALSAASASLSVASDSASSAVDGTPTGYLDSLTNKAAENWEGLVSKASEQVYGTQAPPTRDEL